ncbi:cytochrome P450 [Periconia macrospinosa]|uniref:Cytochrome P450 n=1 Tax=Periconia macrospinosa TaxID=97972 RepID=A0A2V1E5M5_9PLEO|nr:cytochrome P450 [Periconia macrospinosa]
MDHFTSGSVVASDRYGYLLRLIIAIPIFFVLKFSVTLIYNVLFHPLRKYPGPKLAAATDLLHAYYSIKGAEIDWTARMHEQYGEVVRLGPNKLSYTKPEAWRDITGHRTGGRQENSKDPNFYTPDLNGEYNLAGTFDSKDHGKIRRVFSNAFSDKALKLQEGLIRGYVNKLVSNMKDTVEENPSARMNGVKLYNCTTFDVMGDLTFGESLGMLESSEYTPWVRAVFDSIKIAAIFRILVTCCPWVGRLMEAFMPKSLRDLRQSHFDHTIQRVNRRLENDGDSHKPDIWSLVLTKGQEVLAVPQMHANAAMFMIAGTETTATLLSGLTYLLLKHPEKMRKVVDEVRSLTFDDLSLDTLPQLPYLNACFEEGLRCYPPVPNGLPRETPKGGNVICGEWVPEKTAVFVSPKAAFSSEKNFKDAKSFVPERWLPNTGYENDKREVFQPFSFGPRNCLGKNLAYHEMRIILATVLWHFDLELCPESNAWMEQETYVFWEKPPLWIKAKIVR